MSRAHRDYVEALLAERAMPPAEVWKAAEARLDRPIHEGLNSAQEAADRWARDRARLAMIVRHPDGTSDRWTFAELSRASSRLATAWRAAGLRRGDRVAAYVSQQIEAYITALAAWRAGMVYMPLFAGFGPDALAQRINGGEPAAVVVDHTLRARLERALGTVRGDLRIYTVAGPAGRGLVCGDHSLWAEIEGHAAGTAVENTAASDPATLIYTSGTTGAPKGCVQPHSLLVSIQPFIRHTFALRPGDMLFSGANPGWAYGLYTTGFGPMSLGHPRVVLSGDFDPHAWLKVFEEEQVTYVAAAPSAYRRLLQAARRSGLSASVRGATSAGEPLDAPLAEAWRDLTGAGIQDGYGQSEAGMVLANLAYDEKPAVPGALSSIVPGCEVVLVDDDGVPQAEQGIIALHRPKYLAATGYWNRDDLWAARWRGEYFLTGDVGRRDEDGRFRFVGRADDLIVTSGYNVGPSEVEELVLAHPGVLEAAVVGVPDPERGTVVRAVIVANGQVPQDKVAAEVRRTVQDKLGRHAYPRIIDFVDALPRTETGKIQRNLLRSEYERS